MTEKEVLLLLKSVVQDAALYRETIVPDRVFRDWPFSSKDDILAAIQSRLEPGYEIVSYTRMLRPLRKNSALWSEDWRDDWYAMYCGRPLVPLEVGDVIDISLYEKFVSGCVVVAEISESITGSVVTYRTKMKWIPQ